MLAPSISATCFRPATQQSHPARIPPSAVVVTRRQCRAAIQAKAATGAPVDTDKVVAVIKQCIDKPNSVPAPVVLDAMLQLESQKLPVDGWQDILQAPGTHWKLVFTADDKQVQAAKKQKPNKGGIYFPLAACQKFDGTRLDFENGVFLGPLAFLTFNGPYAMKGRQLQFDVVSMNIGIGPWRFSIPIKKNAKAVADMDPQ
eukprot:GHRR01009023.1.p1 GENE.GHRR01009023.1~~GHRR01009023.1.p1  ORF type:complete len:201 (+),score=68.97 GHRR01009023.1:103-705(+)